MSSFSAYFQKIIIILLICHVNLYSQNIGVGTMNPTAKIHLKSTIENVNALDLEFESGAIDPQNTSGDYNWYVTSVDGYNSAQSAKAPILPSVNQTANLMYSFNLALGKEVTVSFNYKNIDPTGKVSFVIYSDHFSFEPPVTTGWKSFSTTFVSQSETDVIHFDVKSILIEANPTLQVDNVTITYEDGHTLRIEDGNQMDGYYLRSDELGYGEWYNLSAEIDEIVADNYQDLSFDPVQNELSITDGDPVHISGLKNDDNNTLSLVGSEIVASPDMSLHLPSSDPQSPTLHFDAANNTMDWGVSSEPTKGNHSTRWGKNNTATMAYATAWGLDNIASHVSSTTWGTENLASGWRSTTWGFSNEASEYESTSFGKNNTSSGVLSTTWGESNTASGLQSTSFGFSNISSGGRSFTWGFSNEASGIDATAWGTNNVVSGSDATAWGYQNNVTGSRSTAWGSSNEIPTSGQSATAFGSSNDANGQFSIVGGTQNIVNSYAEVAFGRFNNSPTGNTTTWISTDLLFSLGNGTGLTNRKNAVTVLKNGNVGISMDSPDYDLHLGFDSAAKPGTSSWTVSSDRRLKKDITEFSDGLDIISAIEPIWFTYNGLAGMPESTYVGTIAQDLEEIAPYMVTEFTHKDDNGKTENYKAVNYGAMDFVLINAIKEQQQEIADLKAQIAEIMALLDSQKNVASTDNE